MSGRQLRVLLVLDDRIDAAPIEEALPADTRSRVASFRGVAPARLPASDAESDLLIIGAAEASQPVLGLIETAARQRPERPVVVLHVGEPNGFMADAFASGADDLIALPLPQAELAFALEKAVARRRGAAGKPAGRLVSVLGPKGGTGKTLTACNLAVALAQQGRRPVVVDLDLQFGDVGLALGLAPERTSFDLAVSGGSLDADKVEAFLAVHESGARVLLAPVRPDQASTVAEGSFLRSVFDLLRSRFEYVIVDTPPAFSPEVIVAIDSSSELCVVGMLDALSLKDTRLGLETLGQMGVDAADVTVVLNRADSSVGIMQSEVERLLGRRPDVLVPSDRGIPRALTEGRTIVEAAPKSGAAKAFRSLAEGLERRRAGDVVAPGEPSGEPGRRRRLLAVKGAR